ncbi:3-hydroxyacyl-CoA dehydrogenase family protein [Rhizobium rhizogenes]|nr:3-hydroxyacyl-CoA dehydrogenase family protein [Rhizobium rhizogenes]NTH35903.1 3-hydroxyacyl-CoA dehydrogenase family protein [Rhizobium rhizogenes]
MITSQKAAVIGAGTMGMGIAEVLCSKGFDVSLYSRSERTLDVARQHLGSDVTRVHFTTSIEACVGNASVVSENVAEDLELKSSLFSMVEGIVGRNCILTTNTSSVPIGSIAVLMRDPSRLVGLHWFNPPAVMPLLEIVRGPATSDAVIQSVREFAASIGKETIEVHSDLPGFVINRLQYALMREAMHLVETGVASAQDVDRAVETTLASRWSSAGPLKLMDLAGLDTVEKVSGILMPELNNGGNVPAIVKKLVSEGAFGTKSGRGFYEWTPELASEVKAKRDETVKLLSSRRNTAP